MSSKEQATFASLGFDVHRRPTRKHEFLRRMNQVIPWEELVREVEPYYPKGEGRGRPAKPLIWMLKLYFLQLWHGLSDPQTEDQAHDSHAAGEFLGIDLGKDRPPDETTICKFRHLLERRGLGKRLFERVKEYLKERGIRIEKGTIVDATIIEASGSKKNQKRQRDPEMGATRKGQNWYFGMKMHVGVDADGKWIHSVEVTPANVHDSQVVEKLLHGKEKAVYGDRAYIGQEGKIRAKAPRAKVRIERRAGRGRPLSEREKERNRRRARIRCRVEHVFGVMKHVFGWVKVRFRGLAKNRQWAFMMAAAVNLYLMSKALGQGGKLVRT